MKTELIPIDDLKFAAYNPRTISQHDFESLQRSLDEFGVVEPAVVNKRNMTIVGGHQRVRAARELGMEAFPVVYVDLDENKEKALNIALNKISGEWHEDGLRELLYNLDDEATLLTGFTDEDMRKLEDGFAEEVEDKPKEDRFTMKELRTLAMNYGDTPAANLFLDFINDATRKN